MTHISDSICIYLSVSLPLSLQVNCRLPGPVIIQDNAGCRGSWVRGPSTDCLLVHAVVISPDRQVRQLAMLASGGYEDLHSLTNSSRWCATSYDQS